jgi:hypothetical protein
MFACPNCIGPPALRRIKKSAIAREIRKITENTFVKIAKKEKIANIRTFLNVGF